jgi:hypothetical protein
MYVDYQNKLSMHPDVPFHMTKKLFFMYATEEKKSMTLSQLTTLLTDFKSEMDYSNQLTLDLSDGAQGYDPQSSTDDPTKDLMGKAEAPAEGEAAAEETKNSNYKGEMFDKD